jgi:ABC-type multidrug transport system ATPase subunit
MDYGQDPLSALDAHVGRAVFQNVLQTTLSGKTRILITHALHFLPQVDYIFVVSDGCIVEQGTYTELMNSGKEFSRILNEFVSKDDEEEKEKKEVKATTKEKKGKKATPGRSLMQAEERNTGAISVEVYKEYMKAGHGFITIPLLILALILMQGATVISSYW